MRHMKHSNIALILGRQGQAIGSGEWNLVYLAQNISDTNIFYRGGGIVFPLYLYEENMGKMERRVNLDKDIVAKIAEAINPENPVNPVNETSFPLDIFDYIYGILHSPAYRAKFKEFLKSDFPRIPYPKDAAEFALYRDAGRTLRETHLMRDAAPTLSEPTARFPIPGDNIVDVVRWEATGVSLPRETTSPRGSGALAASCTLGRVWINGTQYFDNVPLAAWEQAIGGYHPAEKWLKDRKGRALAQDDLKHYQRIILALRRTREVMDSLAGISFRSNSHEKH